MAHSAVGVKIRERRKALGLTQASLAEKLGVSTSYVNLIEANRRSAGGKLMANLAAALNIDLDALSGAAERRLIDDLGEFLTDPLVNHFQLNPQLAATLVAQHPDWVRAVLTVYRAYRDNGELVNVLSDRLNRDPQLSHAVHKMLSHITAVRSSAEILHDTRDLAPAQQRQFHRVISDESTRLSEVARELVTYFATSNTVAPGATAAEEVDDFIIGQRNYFPDLETVAQQLRAKLATGGGTMEGALHQHLQRQHGFQIRPVDSNDSRQPLLNSQTLFLPDEKLLLFAPAISATTRQFQLARAAAIVESHDIIRAACEDSRLTSSDARERAFGALSSYIAGALLLPYDEFLANANECRFDIEVLRQHFRVSFEQICHRLVTLRRPGAEGIPFAFLRTDASGFISKRFPLAGFPLPRYGHACPLWAAFRAFQTPGQVVRQLAEFPDQSRYLLIARTVTKDAATFHDPEVLYAVLLACDTLHADRTAYAQGLNLVAPNTAAKVGPGCRLCTRHCRQRQESAVSQPVPHELAIRR